MNKCIYLYIFMNKCFRNYDLRIWHGHCNLDQWIGHLTRFGKELYIYSCHPMFLPACSAFFVIYGSRHIVILLNILCRTLQLQCLTTPSIRLALFIWCSSTSHIVIPGQIFTCGNVHSLPMHNTHSSGDQAADTISRYLTQSYYPNSELDSPYPIIFRPHHC